MQETPHTSPFDAIRRVDEQGSRNKYRERATGDYNATVYARSRDPKLGSIESAKAEHELHMSMLDLAWSYYVFVEAMHPPAGPAPRVAIPERPLWIDFSEPFPCPLIAKTFSTQMTVVAAFWFSTFAPLSKYWLLELIGTDGKSVDKLSYDVRTRKWDIASSRRSFCCAQESKPCQQCRDFLKTWRNRFFEALRLIQGNDFRPGIIGAQDKQH